MGALIDVSEAVTRGGRRYQPLGHLDAVTSGGFAEGWAYDRENPAEALLVRVVGAGGEELATGRAETYRRDLAEIGFRQGWCAFRIRLPAGVEALSGTRLLLQDVVTGLDLHATSTWRLVEADDAPLASIEAIAAADPTVLRSLLQLSGYAPLLAAFVERHGIPDFVRTACAYVLGRLPPEPVLDGYVQLLANGAVTPFGLLAVLGESEAWRSSPRLIPSPVHPGFLFSA